MLLILITLFVIGPIAEIYVLLAAGSAFGPVPVIAACLGTAVIGGWIIRYQGLAALNAARRDLNEGAMPVESVVDGVALILAAPFLMTPGFLTDGAGFLLLIPPVRRAIAGLILRELKKRIDRGDAVITIHRP